MFSINEVCAYQEERNVTITEVGSFTDAMGIKNIVGTVENNNDVPVHMLIGLNTTKQQQHRIAPDSRALRQNYLSL